MTSHNHVVSFMGYSTLFRRLLFRWTLFRRILFRQTLFWQMLFRLMTSAVASRIANRPTSSSGLASRQWPSLVASWQVLYLRPPPSNLLPILYANLWCAKLPHKCLKKLILIRTLTLTPNLTLILTVTVSENRNIDIKRRIVLHYTWSCRSLVNVNVKRNDVSVDVNFSRNSICRNIIRFPVSWTKASFKRNLKTLLFQRAFLSLSSFYFCTLSLNFILVFRCVVHHWSLL